MKTLLRYDLMTEPFPLQASPETGNPSAAALTVVASNPAPLTPVVLQGLVITLPVNPDSMGLTEVAEGIGPVPPTGWTLSKAEYSTGAAKYIFYPNKGEGEVKGAGLSFIFNNVELNREPGTVEIQVIEGSGGCMPPNCPTQSLYITKFPNGWGQVQLWTNPDPPLVAPGDSVSLNWAGPSGATYQLQYYTPRDGIVIVPKSGQPSLSNRGEYPPDSEPPLMLDQTTTFYLSIEESIDKRSYSAQQQVTVTVEAHKPIFKLFTGQFLWGNDSYSLALKWDTQNAATCRVAGDPHLLTPSSLNDSYQIVPTLKKPLQHTYMLTAENSVGATISPPATLQWGDTIGSVPIGGGSGIAISSDDKYIYLAMPGESLAKFEFSSILTGSPQPLAQYQASNPFPFDYQRLDTPVGLTLSPDNNLLYVVNGNGGIFAMDADTLKQVSANAPGFSPTAIACPRNGSIIYVAGSLQGYFTGVAAFSLQPNQGPGWLYLDDGSPKLSYQPPPTVMVISPSDGRIFTGHNAGDYVVIWEPSNDHNALGQVGTLQAVQFIPKGIAFSPDGTRIFVVGDGNQIHIYDYETLQPAGQPVPLNINATAIASTFDGTRLLVSDGQTLSVIVPSSLTGGVGG